MIRDVFARADSRTRTIQRLVTDLEVARLAILQRVHVLFASVAPRLSPPGSCRRAFAGCDHLKTEDPSTS